MAEDGIAREAAIRHKRRSKAPGTAVGRDDMMEQASGETSSILSTMDSKALLQQRSVTDSFTTLPSLQNLRRSRFVDRHLHYRNSAFCLPFILCKFHTREAKALINTCVLTSIINRKFYQDLLLGDGSFQAFDIARGVPFVIDNRLIHFDFIIRGDVPDLVLGLDFFTHLECSLDFANRQFIIRQNPPVSTPLLCERELPLRYRNVHNLLASF